MLLGLQAKYSGSPMREVRRPVLQTTKPASPGNPESDFIDTAGPDLSAQFAPSPYLDIGGILPE